MRKSLLIVFLILISSFCFGQKKVGGGYHSITICSDGTVRTWGYNTFGALGDGTRIDKSFPIKVSNLYSIRFIAAGWYHSLALRSDSTLWTWGSNGWGELGIGSTVSDCILPAEVNLGSIVAIAGGYGHSLAVKADGTVWAWGCNIYGALGDSTTNTKTSPVQVKGLTNVICVSAGEYFSLALKKDSTVWAWGDNSSGQLGDGTDSTRLMPVQVGNLTGVVSIAAGSYHSIVVKNDGTVCAWGNNDYGQLGVGDTIKRLLPNQISGLSGITSVAAGQYHCLALKSDSTVYSWGRNNKGQLGDSTTINRLIPQKVNVMANIIEVSAGCEHSLVKSINGKIWSWGRNEEGEIGIGSINFYGISSPVKVIGLCSNTIKGTCYIDYNQNNFQDVGEPGYNNLNVVSSSTSLTWSSFTNIQGLFYNRADSGTTTTTLNNLLYYSYSPAQHVSYFASYLDTDSINFALVPVQGIQDLRIAIIPLSQERVGRNVVYRISYLNVGTDTVSGTIILRKDSLTNVVSSVPNYFSLNGDTLVWTYSNLLPNETRIIDLTLNVLFNAQVGDILTASCVIEPVATDTVKYDNYFGIRERIVGSYDPNNKTMLGGDEVTTAQISNGEYLTYLIRFQNTGNDSAFIIIVRDTLDAKLDWNTFEMVSSSHPYSLSIQNYKNVSWTFNNILLPDSSVDEPGSHAYICYKIKPKNTLLPGDEIKNVASIYFDFNAPVLTDTAITRVFDIPLSINENPASCFIIYPNPTTSSSILKFNTSLKDAEVIIYDMLGKEVVRKNLAGNRMEIEKGSLESGVYFVRVRDGERQWVEKMVVE